MDLAPPAPRSPRAFRILLVLLWLSLLPQVYSILEMAAHSLDVAAEEPWRFVQKGGLFALCMVSLRVWLNWKLGRRRRWARLSLLWLHVIAVVGTAVSMYEVIQHITFYPYYMVELLFYVFCACLLFTYLLNRKDVVAWCRPEAPVDEPAVDLGRPPQA
jgi:hypothetical protein